MEKRRQDQVVIVLQAIPGATVATMKVAEQHLRDRGAQRHQHETETGENDTYLNKPL